MSDLFMISDLVVLNASEAAELLCVVSLTAILGLFQRKNSTFL